MKTLILAAALAVVTVVSTAPSIAAGNVTSIAPKASAKGGAVSRAGQKMWQQPSRALRGKRRPRGKLRGEQKRRGEISWRWVKR